MSPACSSFTGQMQWRSWKQCDTSGTGPWRAVLQIHDELLFEVDEDYAEDAVRCIRSAMEASGRHHLVSVPLSVKVSVGPDWGTLREVYY